MIEILIVGVIIVGAVVLISQPPPGDKRRWKPLAMSVGVFLGCIALVGLFAVGLAALG